MELVPFPTFTFNVFHFDSPNILNIIDQNLALE